MKKQSFKCQQFTLIELAVVVAVSVLLLTVTMLLSGCGEESSGSSGSSGSSSSSGSKNIDNARRRANCVSQLNNLGKAMIMYGDVNKCYIPTWDGDNRNNLATNDNNVYDTQDATSTVTPGNKILLGGYMGMTLTEVDKKSAEKTFKCPSDGDIFDGKNAASYIYMPMNNYQEYPQSRMIIGRDNPGSSLMYDMHSALVAGDTGGAAKLPKKGGNHSNVINVLYFGGHVKAVNVPKDKKVDFTVIDEITY